MDTFLGLGAGAFGLVIGWVTYFILRRAQPKALSDISTIIGILGGATILGLFEAKGLLFAAYATGLAVGFFAYLIAYTLILKVSGLREALLKDDGAVLG